MDATNHFSGFATVVNGLNNIPISAKDFSNNVTNKTIQVTVPTGTLSGTPTYDILGNLTNNGSGMTFEWDGKNEMTAINYATPIQQKLNGTIIGTPGSYQNIGNTIAKVFDGNGSTFFDGPMASGDWVGLDLGAGNQAPVNHVRFTCRSGNGSRMVGGQFQTS